MRGIEYLAQFIPSKHIGLQAFASPATELSRKTRLPTRGRLRWPTQIPRTGHQTSVVVIIETSRLHQGENPFHVILNPVQPEISVIHREGRPRIIVPRLSHGTGITVCLRAEFVQGLNVGMSREKYVAINPREILRAWLKVLVDRIRPSGMDQLHVSDAPKYRECTNPIHVFCGQHFPLIHQTVVYAF